MVVKFTTGLGFYGWSDGEGKGEIMERKEEEKKRKKTVESLDI